MPRLQGWGAQKASTMGSQLSRHGRSPTSRGQDASLPCFRQQGWWYRIIPDPCWCARRPLSQAITERWERSAKTISQVRGVPGTSIAQICYGSLADIRERVRDVLFTPKADILRGCWVSPLSAMKQTCLSASRKPTSPRLVHPYCGWSARVGFHC